MARAVLQIDADTSGLAAAFGAATRAAQQAEQAARRAGNAYRSSAREMVAGERTVVAEAQRAVMAQVRAEQQRARAARMGADARARAEREATRVAQEESRKRGLTAEQETRVRTSALERYTRLYETEERRQTVIATREARNRTRALAVAQREATARGSQIGTGLRRGLNVGGDAALNVGRQAHTLVQDARHRRAIAEHTINAALFQAGVSGPEASRAHGTIQREISTGSLRGFSMDDVAGALMGAQTQFSSLSGVTETERSENLAEQVRLMSFARNTFQDPGEVLRVAGMLRQQGVRGENLTGTIQAMTGMASAGAIELSTLTGTALGPLMQNVARMTSPTQTPEQRAAAVRAATLETMAFGEITSRGGLTPRHALNALATLRGEVESPLMASRLRNRLTNEGRGELADRLTQVDATGRVSLRNRSTLGFMSELTEGMGGDANAVANLLRSGGSRNAMVLGSPVRTLINAMASQTGSGGTIAGTVAEMQRAGERFGGADVARGAAMIEGEQKTALASAEAVRDDALTDNTDEIINLSNQFADWSTANPVQSSLIQGGGGLLGGVLGGALFPRIGQALAATRVGSLLTGAAGGAASGSGGAAAVASAPLIGAGAAAGLAGAPLIGGMYLNARTAATGRDVAGTEVGTGERILAALGALNPALSPAFGDSIARALAAATITATVSPVDAAQASAQAPAPSAATR